MGTSTVSSETDRLAALQAYEVLDSPAEPDFDELALLAARICETPIALVTLVDEERQWFKARVGLDISETPRHFAFCHHAIQQADLFVVPDATQDPRFADNPLVIGDPGIRFYAGAPLLSPEGQALGTLCVIDRVPRSLDAGVAEALSALSRQVIAQLELRRSRKDLLASESLKTRIIESSQDCIKVLDLDGHLLSMNAGGMQMLEICDLAPLVGSSWIEFWEGADHNAAATAVAAAQQGGVGKFVGFFRTAQTHRPMWFDVAVSKLGGAPGAPDRLLAVSRDVTARKEAEDKLRALTAGTAKDTGATFFRSLVRHLAQGLHAEYAFLAECTDATKTRVQTLAFWSGQDFADNIAFALAGTPCENVIAGEVCVHRDQLQSRFPEDVGLVGMRAESYFGIPLRSGNGETVGHIAVIDTHPMEPTADDLALMRIFAARAGAELERQKADQALREALTQLEALKNQLQAENIYLKEEIRAQHGFEEIIGQSPLLLKVLDTIGQVAPTDATVLIRGETGTGKELIARAIHARSPRKGHPFIAVNCGAISAGLVESELFGHERGAFTGAVGQKIGRFELANGGTIFLDEIGDLQPDLQVKLLRVVQEGEFQRVGGRETIRVNARVIAATHRDLEDLVQEEQFRADLYYRLNVFPIQAPALRERHEDIPPLVRHFVLKHAQKLGKRIETIPTDVMDLLCSYTWPGNIRELGNVLERSVIVTEGAILRLGDWLPATPQPPSPRESVRSLEEMERAHIVSTLERLGWKVSGANGAAAALGLRPTTLESRMKRLGIKRPG